MIKVTCTIETYDDPAKTSITVNNHWNSNRFVELIIGDEKRIVRENELKAAIDNGTNTVKF